MEEAVFRGKSGLFKPLEIVYHCASLCCVNSNDEGRGEGEKDEFRLREHIIISEI